MATIPLNYSSVGQVFLNDLNFLNKTTPANGGNGQIQVAGKVYNVSLTTNGIQVSPEKSVRNFFSMSAKSTASAVQADLRDQMQTWLAVQKSRPDDSLPIFKSVQSNIRLGKDNDVITANENAAQTLLTATAKAAKAANVMGLQLHQPVHAAYGDAYIRHDGTQAFHTNARLVQQEQFLGHLLLQQPFQNQLLQLQPFQIQPSQQLQFLKNLLQIEPFKLHQLQQQPLEQLQFLKNLLDIEPFKLHHFQQKPLQQQQLELQLQLQQLQKLQEFLQLQQPYELQFNSITIDKQNAIVGVEWHKFGISSYVGNNGQVHEASHMLDVIRAGRLVANPNMAPGYGTNGYTQELSTAWIQLLQKNVDKLDIIGRITTMRNNNTNNAQGFDTAVKALVRKNMSVGCQADLLRSSGINPQQPGAGRAPTLEHFVSIFANALKLYEQSISNGDSQQQAHAQAQQAFATYPAAFQQELCQHLDNIVRNAVFRQTSKLGLELYKQQGIPVVFQWRDHSGQDNSAQVRPVNQQDWWHTGFTLGTPQVMPITMSEQRHVERLETSGAAAVRPADNIVVLKV